MAGPRFRFKNRKGDSIQTNSVQTAIRLRDRGFEETRASENIGAAVEKANADAAKDAEKKSN